VRGVGSVDGYDDVMWMRMRIYVDVDVDVDADADETVGISRVCGFGRVVWEAVDERTTTQPSKAFYNLRR